MAFVQRMLRHTPLLRSHFASIRLSSTLTSPKLFVSGLSRLTTDEKLKEAFSSYGQLIDGNNGHFPPNVLEYNILILVQFMLCLTFGHFDYTAKVITDRASGRSKGFGFVTYTTIEEAEKAREGMNAKFLDGWVIFVDPAKPREPRPPQQSQSQPSETGFTVNKTVGWCG
ncbi:organelle RRM domain-containing protein 2, mitochondrial isoform X1 [Abrus precatorius]|uniref:Organelle RRM domain-containing protein 2, mitochondrial isoform X1 n=1 Tax=Abrus precatorius TaxID=3816 RepID=A0A8B8L8K3_ABRPR|nr:organelle RRM domain-containing protein 2, mitochondrial isoform X1 [Abrus precatorius]